MTREALEKMLRRFAEPARDREGELAFLLETGPPDWVQFVVAQLDEKGEPEHGDKFAWCSIDELWDEVLDEAVDLAAWATLIQRRLELDEVPEAQRRRARGALVAAVAHARQAADLIELARHGSCHGNSDSTSHGSGSPEDG